MNRQVGRGKPGSSSSSADGETRKGQSGWRTYAQAKNSEAFFRKKRHLNTGSNSKGYRQNTGYQQQNQQRERTPKPEKSSESSTPGPSSSSTASTEEKDIEVIAHIRRNSDWNQQQRPKVVNTGPSFDPFHPLPLAPPPSQNQVAKMYEEMLYTAAIENSSSTQAKGLKTVGDSVRFAEEHSSGFFVRTNSKYGNNVMPVLPRL